jgi:hypothetical protein
MAALIRRFRRQDRAVGLIIAATVFGITIAAQQPPAFRTEANHIRVDVYATRDGVPRR